MNGFGVTETEFLIIFVGILGAFPGKSFWTSEIFSLQLNYIFCYSIIIGSQIQMIPLLINTFKETKYKKEFITYFIPFILISTGGFILCKFCPDNFIWIFCFLSFGY